MPPPRTWIIPCVALVWAACQSAGLYNFARTYEPLDAEQAHFRATQQQIAYEDVKRDPERYADTELGWFGVVTSYAELPDGKKRLGLSLRAHQARHLCSERRETSCRVTVSEKSLGELAIDVALTKEQLSGKDRVWIGSLLKVYGKPTGAYDEDGALILAPSYLRHFPRGTFVTTAARDTMRM